MLQIFAEVLIPVYLVVAIGYALARLVGAAHKNVVTLSYWVLGPAFTFNVLATANLSAGAVLQIVVATVATMTVIGLAAAGFGRIAGTPRSLTSASILTSIYPNAGNFGLAMAVFALGPEALPAAGLVLVASNSYGILVGVGLANIEKASPLIALRKAVTTPLVLALIPAIVVNVTNFDVPIWLIDRLSFLPAP